jgi:hypothetical protein
MFTMCADKGALPSPERCVSLVTEIKDLLLWDSDPVRLLARYTCALLFAFATQVAAGVHRFCCCHATLFHYF